MNRGATGLRALLATGKTLAAPGVFDPYTARIVERAGFEALYLGGNALGLHLGKGQPFVNLSDTAAMTAAIARTVDTPLIVDAGTGFGDAAHLFRAVRELHAAGAAGVHLDDQPYPKSPDYHRGRGRLVPLADAITRLRVGIAARPDPRLLIIARTDVWRVTKSRDETRARCRAYAETGVDAIMVLDLEPHDAPALRATVPVPLVWIGGVVPPVPSLAALEAGGFALAVYPFNTIAAVTAAVDDLWRGMRATGCIGQPDALLGRIHRETMEIIEMPTYWQLADKLAGESGDR
jgi:2-methylisocitrate lyase-like PEP mutase family enzyme